MCEGFAITGMPAASSAALVRATWRWCISRSAFEFFKSVTAAWAAAATEGGSAVVKMNEGA